MQAIPVIGVSGERVAAAKLCLEIPPGLHVRNAGLEERGWEEVGACRMLGRLASGHERWSIQVAMSEQ
jgi:hypothetical protein